MVRTNGPVVCVARVIRSFKVVAPVPPFPIASVPVTSVARFTSPVETTPAVARSTPESPVIVTLSKKAFVDEMFVVDAFTTARRLAASSYVKPASPAKRPLSLYCTCVSAPPGAPTPAPIPSDDVATSEYPPRPSPIRSSPYAGSVASPVPPLSISSVPESVSVPLEVIGPPANERPVVPPEASTEVTPPDPPLLDCPPRRSSMLVRNVRSRCSRYS